MLNKHCIPREISLGHDILSFYILLDLFVKILFKILESVFMRDDFLVMFLALYQGNAGFIGWVGKYLFLFNILEELM